MAASSPYCPTIVSAGAAMILCGMLLVPGFGPAPARAQEPADRPHHTLAVTHEHPAHQPAHPVAHGPPHHQTAPIHGRHTVLHPSTHPVRTAHHAAQHAAAPAVVPVPAPAPPELPPAPLKGSNTGLPLPRFASLRADAVNMRSGPGTRYPIQWVYKRRDLPVRIEREFDVWRLVEDSDGVKGWVHQATLVGTRSFVILGNGSDTPGSAAAGPGRAATGPDAASATIADPTPGSRMLRAAPQPDGQVVAILKPGVIGRIRTCPAGSGWCRVSIRDYSGWLPRNAFWGLLSDETILPP